MSSLFWLICILLFTEFVCGKRFLSKCNSGLVGSVISLGLPCCWWRFVSLALFRL